MGKRYYWLRLKKDFFDSIRCKKLRKLAGGDTFTIIYLKMMLESIANDGVICFEGVEKSFEEELAIRLDEGVENVQLTVAYLKQVGLLEVSENGAEYALPEAQENIGSESSSAERVRRMREKQKLALTKKECRMITQAETNNSTTVSESKAHKKDYGTDFELFWNEYPRKIGKGDAYKAYMARLKDGWMPEQLVEACKRYAQSVKKNHTSNEYIKHPKTFLSSTTPFADYLPEKKSDLATNMSKSETEW